MQTTHLALHQTINGPLGKPKQKITQRGLISSLETLLAKAKEYKEDEEGALLHNY